MSFIVRVTLFFCHIDATGLIFTSVWEIFWNLKSALKNLNFSTSFCLISNNRKWMRPFLFFYSWTFYQHKFWGRLFMKHMKRMPYYILTTNFSSIRALVCVHEAKNLNSQYLIKEFTWYQNTLSRFGVLRDRPQVL